MIRLGFSGIRIHRKLIKMAHSTPRPRLARWRTALSAFTAAAALILAAAPGHAQDNVAATYGDWRMECDTPPGAETRQCALTQSVLAEDRDNVGLVVIVLKTADHTAQLMRIVAPLGVLLPAPFGLGLTIDDEYIDKIPFVRCVAEGCVAEILLEPEILAKLRNGTTATFSIFTTPEEGIGIPVSLVGLGEGFDALP